MSIRRRDASRGDGSSDAVFWHPWLWSGYCRTVGHIIHVAVLTCAQACSHALRRAYMRSGVLICAQACLHALRHTYILLDILIYS